MDILSLIKYAGILIIGMMFALWILSLLLKNASIVDIFWGLGFIAVAWFGLALADGFLPRKLLIYSLTTIWGLRLALHIGIRNWGQPEDFRYAAWRQESGANWWWYSFFKVFLLQGVLMWIISTPLLAAQTPALPSTLTWIDMLGASLWTFGLLFESVGDLQLARFKRKAENKGKLLTTGLWKYTRHPNYFGEAVLWWGCYLIALAAGAWWTVFSPILITWLLLRVSGVAMLERTMKLKPGYEEYMQKTNAFLPGRPRQ